MASSPGIVFASSFTGSLLPRTSIDGLSLVILHSSYGSTRLTGLLQRVD
jgi:hypothetical protein